MLPVQGRRPLRVVLVDDTADIRLLLRAALEADGAFEVVGEAGDGATGVEVVAAARPDLVLVDLAMPVLDGLEALPALRRACPSAHVVVLSGFGADAVVTRARAAGADAYLQKGIAPAELRARLLEIARVPAPAGPRPDAAGEVSRWLPDVVEGAPFGVVEVALPEGRVVRANPAARALLGVTGGAPLQLPEGLEAAVRAHAPALRAGGGPVELDAHVAPGPLRVTLTAAAGGAVAYLVPNSGDVVTWLRSAIAGAVHEMRNPTIVIAGAVAALQVTAPTLREDLLGAIARQARLLDRATADLLTAAQAHRGGLRVDPRPVVLADVLRAALADAAAVGALPGAHASPALDCAPDLVVRADPLRVQQMLLNLLGNAVKYGLPPVRVDARADGDDVRVCVRDAGPGIPPDAVATVFDEFTRAAGTGAPGTGLGLFVVRALAQAQGGRAWYEAAPEGGAVLAFTLPLAKAPGAPGPAAPPPAGVAEVAP